jgi:hypothetical protein
MTDTSTVEQALELIADWKDRLPDGENWSNMIVNKEVTDKTLAFLAALAKPVASPECPSCHGLNTSCPDGCGRDPETGELDGTRLAPPQPVASPDALGLLMELRSQFHDDGRCQIVRHELIERIDRALAGVECGRAPEVDAWLNEASKSDDIFVKEGARIIGLMRSEHRRLAQTSCSFASPDALVERLRGQAFEEAAGVVDQCNREGPYNAIGAAKRIRELALSPRPVDEVREALTKIRGILEVSKHGKHYASACIADTLKFVDETLASLEGVSDAQFQGCAAALRRLQRPGRAQGLLATSQARVIWRASDPLVVRVSLPTGLRQMQGYRARR